MKRLVSYNTSGLETTTDPPSRLSRCQILFILALPLLFIMAGLLSKIIPISLGPVVSTNPILSTMIGFVIGIVVFIVFVPRVLRMPNGKNTLRHYLHDIGVDRIRPLSRTLLIFLLCLTSILVSQIVGSLVYNQFVLEWDFDFFLDSLFDSSRIRTAIGLSPITAVGSIFEEIVLRGVVLTILLQVYSERKAIVVSAVAFGYVHIINLLNGVTYNNLIFVVGQITWTTIIGLLYGYMFLRTGNLYANMFLHWTVNGLSNCFMFLPSITPEMHVILNIVFNIGLMSTLISILCVALINKYWQLTTQEKGMKLFPSKWQSGVQLGESKITC